ncbi:MAG: hypothetical protein FVQ77_04900 [Cytophagales bacterium]|nr:hypothetical protein [Cytophagales bacterium]
MKKTLLFICACPVFSVVILLNLCFNLCSAQTTVCTGDTALLILNSYRGSIQWQQSTDSITWDSIPGATSDTEQVIVDTTTWYRAQVIEGTCQPVYSGIKKFIIIPGFCCGTDSVQDADGNWYNTVLIGTQCWMAENLNVGTYVAVVTGGQTNNAVIQKYCQNLAGVNDTTCPLGGLYEWGEAVQYLNGASNTTSPTPAFSGNVQGVCPTGWHLPTDAEWCTMENTVEAGTDPSCSLTGWRGTNTGGMLKQAGTTNWTTPNTCTGSCNSSNFTALPGGGSWAGTFFNVGIYGYWWTAAGSGATIAWIRYLHYINAQVTRKDDNKPSGFSVRCIQDCPLPATPDTINGSTNVNTGQPGVSYSIDTVPGVASYTWTVPPGATIASGQGTDSITVDFDTTSGDVCVTATNSCGTSSASCLAVTVNPAFVCGTDSVQDADGNWYNTVLIGTQCWMAENLNVGTYVPVASGGQAPVGTQKYCQNLSGVNDPTCPFGGLYEWDEMMDGSLTCNGTAPPPDDNVKCTPPVQGVCPTGWHVPSHYEWTLLEKNVGTNPGAFPYDVTTTGWLGTDEGGNLKQTGTTNWTTPNAGATNSSGFTALPGGYSWSGSFVGAGNDGILWSSTENSGTLAWIRNLNYAEARVFRDNNNKAFGFSVRCVKD